MDSLKEARGRVAWLQQDRHAVCTGYTGTQPLYIYFSGMNDNQERDAVAGSNWTEIMWTRYNIIIVTNNK